MITAITISLLGAWSYAGFAGEPAPPRPPAPASAPPADEPAGPPQLPRDPAPPVAPTVRQTTVLPQAPPRPSPTVRYRLVDGCGQTWEHPDPTYLSAWVVARNQSGAGCRRPSTVRFRP